MSRYYARVDTLGRVVGFYSDDVHGPRRIKIVDPSFNKATTPEGDWPVVAVVDHGFDPRPQPKGDWPTVQAPNPGYEPNQPVGPENQKTVLIADPNFEPPTVIVRDENFEPPYIEISNPETKIPTEAFEISVSTWQAWLADTANQVWDFSLNAGSGDLVQREIPLEERRNTKIVAIHALREAKAKPGTISIDVGSGRLIPVDVRGERDFRNILGLVTAAQNGAGPFQFRDAMDHVHTIDTGEMVRLGLAVQRHVSAVYEASWRHKDNLAALDDIASIDAYDIESGWSIP